MRLCCHNKVIPGRRISQHVKCDMDKKNGHRSVFLEQSYRARNILGVESSNSVCRLQNSNDSI